MPPIPDSTPKLHACATERPNPSGTRCDDHCGSAARVLSHDQEPLPERVIRAVAGALQVIETTELRWFTGGHLPTELASWFTNGGTRGAVEHRCDLYLTAGRPDLGVKLRAQEILEFKVRRSVTVGRAGTTGPSGHVEVWNKWSPAAESVIGDCGGRWIDVDKRITRRRFSSTGAEVVLTGGERSMAGVGCDIELVEVRVGSTEAWSLAFAAFGPLGSHRTSMAASWRALAAVDGPPESMWPQLDVSCGYPQWLGRATTLT